MSKISVPGRRELRERGAHLVEAFLDALGDADLAFAREQLDRAHLAHVHADGVGRAAELGVDGRERGGGFLGGVLVVRYGGVGENQRLGVRCLLVHRDAHIVDHVDDVFDLLRIDDLARQVVVDLAVREVTLLLAFRDEQLQLRLTFVFLELCLGCFRGHEFPLGGEGRNRTGQYTRLGLASLGTGSVNEFTSKSQRIAPMQDPCQGYGRGSLCTSAARSASLTEMLERGRELVDGRLLGLDAERRLGHDALEILKVGVVPQLLKHARGAAVGDVGGGREDAAQQIGARLIQRRQAARESAARAAARG